MKYQNLSDNENDWLVNMKKVRIPKDTFVIESK